MLQTRHPALLEFALNVSSTLPLARTSRRSTSARWGTTWPRDSRANSTPTRFITFNFLPTTSTTRRAPHGSRRLFHPTWNLGEATLSGHPSRSAVTWRAMAEQRAITLCPSCGGVLHHLITIDPIPHGLGMSRASRRSQWRSACPAWDGSRRRYFTTARRGGPAPRHRSFRRGRKAAVPRRTASCRPLVHLVKTPPRWRWQDWARVQRAREPPPRRWDFPCWIQSAAHPDCPAVRRGDALPDAIGLQSADRLTAGNGSGAAAGSDIRSGATSVRSVVCSGSVLKDLRHLPFPLPLRSVRVEVDMGASQRGGARQTAKDVRCSLERRILR